MYNIGTDKQRNAVRAFFHGNMLKTRDFVDALDIKKSSYVTRCNKLIEFRT